MIQIACPQCKKGYRLADKFAGKKVKCKQCGQLLKIKDLPADTSPASPSPKGHPQSPAPQITPQEEIPMAIAEPLAAGSVQGEPILAAPVVAAPIALEPMASGAVQRPGTRQTEPTQENQDLHATTPQLQYRISQRPDFSIAQVHIAQGQKIYAEPSAMVSMSPSVHLEAGFKGGLGKTFGRLLGGESLIINTFTAQDGPGEIMFAGGAAGDVAHHRLTGNTLYLQRGAYMFNSEGVEVSGKWQGAKGFFSGEGLVLLKASGVGDLFFNSYGAIMPIDVKEGFMVDTGYVVAFEETLDYRVTVLPGLRAAGKVKSFFFGGEGLVCQFSGTGRVWIQTRQAKSFLSWVHAFRPVKSNN